MNKIIYRILTPVNFIWTILLTLYFFLFKFRTSKYKKQIEEKNNDILNVIKDELVDFIRMNDDYIDYFYHLFFIITIILLYIYL
jgi:hypothetical protein